VRVSAGLLLYLAEHIMKARRELESHLAERHGTLQFGYAEREVPFLALLPASGARKDGTTH